LGECAQVSTIDQVGQDILHRALVPAEARNYRIHDSYWIQTVVVQGMSHLLREKREERELSASVSFSKRVDGVQFCEEMCCLFREIFLAQALKAVCVRELTEQLVGLRLDVFRIAKGIASL
jgi:hypothetical protein